MRKISRPFSRSSSTQIDFPKGKKKFDCRHFFHDNIGHRFYIKRGLMSELNIVKDCARQALIITAAAGGCDNFLWDRAQRLVRNAEYICRLPELNKAGFQIDRFCLLTATYFNDAGRAHYLEGRHTKGKMKNLGPGNDGLLDASAQIAEEKLASVLNAARLKTVGRIIVESGDHFTNITEAMILSDARNLDDMGAAGIVNEMRKYAADGKTVADALQTWKRKADYRYWQARLKEGFKFNSVRKLAEHRLAAAEYFMNQLKLEHLAEDLEAVAGNLSSVTAAVSDEK